MGGGRSHYRDKGFTVGLEYSTSLPSRQHGENTWRVCSRGCVGGGGLVGRGLRLSQ